MGFILGQLQTLGIVVLVMACAAIGTVGMLKLIKRFAPGEISLPGTISKKTGDFRDNEK